MVHDQTIVAAIEGSWHTMLKQLLAQLKTELQLPKCLQVVGYLRRMQAFSTTELKLAFLQLRDIWLTNILANIPTENGKFKFKFKFPSLIGVFAQHNNI